MRAWSPGLARPSHRGGKTLALGPVTDQGTLVYPGSPDSRFGTARLAPFYMASWAYPPIFCDGVEIVWRTLRGAIYPAMERWLRSDCRARASQH